MTGVARVVSRILEQFDTLSIPYVIGGSFASSYWGEARQTNDLDVAIRISADQGDRLAEALGEEFMIHASEIRETLNDPEPSRSFQAIHYEEVFKIDIFVPLDTPYTRSEFERALRVEMLPGLFVRCSAPENVVLRKLLWYEAGNRVSDRQWNDIVRVLEFQRPDLDYAYLGRWARELGVERLLEDALSQRTGEPDRFA